jgi:SAM-dependent methyltransferase
MPAFVDPETIEDNILHALADFRSTRVLEIGCGDGRMMRHYVPQSALAVGLDLDRDEMMLSREDHLKPWQRRVRLVQGRAEALPFPDASFDLVIFGWSLCCVLPSGKIPALREGWRVAASVVLDIRPVVDPPQVWVRDRAGHETACGELSRRPGGPRHYHAEARAALDRALAEGWFTLAEAHHFEWVDTYADAEELVASVEEDWEDWIVGEDTSLALIRALARAGRGAVPFTRQGIQAQLLRKVQERSLV